jgi:hypothetical protein
MTSCTITTTTTASTTTSTTSSSTATTTTTTTGTTTTIPTNDSRSNNGSFAKRQTLDDLPHCYVRLECNFVDGMIQGHVHLEYNDGSYYEGPWVEDLSYSKPIDSTSHFQQNHWGKFFLKKDQSIWEGEQVDNFFSPLTATGYFQIKQKDGSIYEGDVFMGKFHGFGKLQMNFTFSKGEYIGEWCEGKRQGYGIEKFDIGECYEGDWQNDLYHGQGEIIYDDQSRYEGLFRLGQWHGEGIRTLTNGDQIRGNFENGFLNGFGTCEFADKRHYHGEFQRTRRHGMGVLTFPNGDRYEGPFWEDLQHGEGKFFTKATDNFSHKEPIVRLGKWVHGERVAWLSKPSTQLATKTFIEYFCHVKKSTSSGEQEIDLILYKFKTPYAVMIASQLPNLPDGVDSEDEFVQIIVKMLTKSQNIVIGAQILEKTIEKHVFLQKEMNFLQEKIDFLTNEKEIKQRNVRMQQKEVAAVEMELNKMIEKEQEMQIKVETFWKKDRQFLERQYKQAVKELNDLDLQDWFKLRTAKLDGTVQKLMEAFCVLLNFKSNYHLKGKIFCPTRDDLLMLLSSNEENVILGDKEGLIHQYRIKALYILPLFDVYSFGESTRNEMLNSLTHVIHHPRLRPNNYRLYQISPACTAICTWVRAAYFYAKKAVDIYPVVKRVMEQMICIETQRQIVQKENVKLQKCLEISSEINENWNFYMKKTKEKKKEIKQLEQIMQEIQRLDELEDVPLTKTNIKKPRDLHSSSKNSRPTTSHGDDLEQTKAKAMTGATAVTTAGTITTTTTSTTTTIIQQATTTDSTTTDFLKTAKVPDEGFNVEAEEKNLSMTMMMKEKEEKEEEEQQQEQEQRVESKETMVVCVKKNEKIFEKIMNDPELSQAFEILKKEINKVLEKNGGRIPIEEFPLRFQENILRPFDPTFFGIKKMRTLLEIMDDVCRIVPPRLLGESESIEFSIEEDEVPMLPRLSHLCRLCPGMSFHTKEELLVHQRTKWHFWNLQAKKKGLPSIKYTLSSTYWSEVYDSIDGSICYYNKMTGEIVKSEEPPMEMQANDIMMELLVDQQQQQQQPVTDATTTGIESSSTQEGGVVETYLYNGSEGQYDTYDTYDATTTTTTTTTGEIEDDSSYQVDYGNYYGTSITSDNNDNTEQQQFSSENSHEYYYSYYDYSVANGYDYTATDWSASTAGTEENGAWQQPTAEEIDVAWEEVADEQGNVYFYNRITYESSWTRPEKMSSTNNTVLDTSL